LRVIAFRASSYELILEKVIAFREFRIRSDVTAFVAFDVHNPALAVEFESTFVTVQPSRFPFSDLDSERAISVRVPRKRIGM